MGIGCVPMTDEEMEDYYDAPQEGDIVMGGDRGREIASCEGKVIGIHEDRDQLEKMVLAWMDERRYWPNVWYVSDHGNPVLVLDLGG